MAVTQSLNSKELVARTLRFQCPERLPYDLPPEYGSDFVWVGMTPSPDERPRSGVDEWGAVWENIGVSILGQVKDFPLKDWADFDRLHVPDIEEPRRWSDVQDARRNAGDKFLLGHGVSIYERLHFIRGLENTWIDIHESPAQLCRLIDILVEQNLAAIKHYAAAGFDGLIMADDWGLQKRLMISPDQWRAIWKPRYARIYRAAHDAGLFTFLHSCGYIVDILDDLIEIGLDAVHMDQQENMGLELLGSRFGGRITFFAPVDIQRTMSSGTLDDIRAYCRHMTVTLGRPAGGFIPRWYTDPAGAGHRPEALAAMCQEFVRLSSELPARQH
ncbi:MAG TPA: uroporphyrinogen decarboxylase family protein [Anaerolineae bacterium]